MRSALTLGPVFLAASIVACTSPTPVRDTISTVVSPDLVISQVYGGGGNTGAIFNHDFVELFNRGSTPRSVNNLSLQYGPATANFVALHLLGTATVAPGQYYLVALASGANGRPLPAPDESDATVNLSSTNGKIMLVASTTLLNTCGAAATPCTDPRIIDLVGYGTASQFEGAAVPALSNTTAAIRGSAGCIDSDNNSTDFAVLMPMPRNTSTTAAPCAAIADAGLPDADADVVDADADIFDADALVTDAIDVDADASDATADDAIVLDGEPAETGAGDAGVGDAEAGDAIASMDAESADGGPGDAIVAMDASDAGAQDATAPDALADGGVTTDAMTADAGSPDGGMVPVPTGLVISQVFGAGGNTGAVLNHDFVEIFNRGGTTQSLSGLSIQYGSAAGTIGGSPTGTIKLVHVLSSTAALAPGQYYLVQLAGGVNGGSLPAPDEIDTNTNLNLSGTNGKVALVAGTDPLGCGATGNRCSRDRIADLVGYGTATASETMSLPALSATTGALRKANGCQDTDNNAADFTVGTPAPRNSSTTPAVCSSGGGDAGQDNDSGGDFDAGSDQDSGNAVGQDATARSDSGSPASGSDAATTDRGTGTTPPNNNNNGGCSCNATRTSGATGESLVALGAAIIGLGLGRRRRRG
jgi:MYXO-CTERM domain-containing protein